MDVKKLFSLIKHIAKLGKPGKQLEKAGIKTSTAVSRQRLPPATTTANYNENSPWLTFLNGLDVI